MLRRNRCQAVIHAGTEPGRPLVAGMRGCVAGVGAHVPNAGILYSCMLMTISRPGSDALVNMYRASPSAFSSELGVGQKHSHLERILSAEYGQFIPWRVAQPFRRGLSVPLDHPILQMYPLT